MTTFIRATYHPDLLTVEYVADNGDHFLRSGGTIAWRFNNPGNLRPGPKYTLHIGRGTTKSGEFLIFPTVEAGRAEKRGLLLRKYKDDNVAQMMEQYAPRSENNTDKYVDYITTKSGIGKDAIVGKLSVSDLGALIQAMEQYEGFNAQADTRKETWVRATKKTASNSTRPIVGQQSTVKPNPAGVFTYATDHASSAQGNLVQGGHSPVWHGGSSNNPAAQWGIRTKEFGGRGYNQLVFDDTDQQGRIQLKTTQAATELNLGHLIHTADNYRGSARGQGAELRTDAYGAVRAGAGLLISSYGIPHDARARGKMTDNAPGVGQMQQALRLTQAFSDAASLHRSVAFTQHLNALCSAARDMHHSIDADNTPHDTGSAPIIALAAQSSLGLVAGQDVQLATGETLALVSGQDSQFITGHQARFHSGQAIGLLSGAIAPGEGNTGLQLIAAQGAIDLQAQGDSLSVQAKDDLKVISANSHLDFAAAKSITLSVSGGASLTISGGNITFSCPGKLLMQATLVEFGAGAGMGYPLPMLPQSVCVECLKKAQASGSPFATR